SRREFLSASSVLAWSAAAPALFQRIAQAAPASNQPGGHQNVLVVVQLTGGNDGLNTVVPFTDPAYIAARPTLKQSAAQVKKINDSLGLHPSLGGFAQLLEQGQLAILQGIGSPNPNRSHFVSMDIWHKATAAVVEQPLGWIGRAIPQLGGVGAALQIGDEAPALALVGATGNAPELKSLSDYQLKVAEKGDDAAKREAIEQLASGSNSGGGLRDLVRRSAQETYKSAASLREIGEKYETPVMYPATGLAGRLKLVAQLIDAGVPERVYYTSLAGFDTHADQAAAHARLLQELGDAVSAFHADLKHHGHADRVVTLTFSEFGRRVRENGSQGTDHGAAAPCFVVGPVKAGPLGAHPSLTDLTDGDLKFHTDFRSIYATLLEQWLKVPSREVLGDAYPVLPLL
ncbi:MAG TPA: DUF1501 domain-containing protein, partial [Planctomycetaceae bacterium]|nr:DUF1501 domain-containing protein [Planctomycetaceae bacterium]